MLTVKCVSPGGDTTDLAHATYGQLYQGGVMAAFVHWGAAASIQERLDKIASKACELGQRKAQEAVRAAIGIDL